MKSCRTTLAGLKGISISYSEVTDQSRILETSEVVILKPSQLRIEDSKSTLMQKGSLTYIFIIYLNGRRSNLAKKNTNNSQRLHLSF